MDRLLELETRRSARAVVFRGAIRERERETKEAAVAERTAIVALELPLTARQIQLPFNFFLPLLVLSVSFSRAYLSTRGIRLRREREK